MAMSGLKVEPEALLTFAMGLVSAMEAPMKDVADGYQNLGVSVARTGMPNVALFQSWNNAIIDISSQFLADFGEGTEAISAGATTIAAVYQESDGDAQAKLDAVYAAFNPGEGDESLEDARAQAAADAQARGEKTQEQLEEEARQNALAAKGAEPPPSTASGRCELTPVEAATNHQEAAARAGESEDYEAPDGVPEGLGVTGQEPAPDGNGGSSGLDGKAASGGGGGGGGGGGW